jgi:hypothetical protein
MGYYELRVASTVSPGALRKETLLWDQVSPQQWLLRS